MSDAPTLTAVLDRIEDRRKTLYVHAAADDEGAEVATRLSARNATVRRRPLPVGETEGFVAVRERDALRGVVPLSVLRTFSSLSIRADWDRDAPLSDGSDYRALFELLDDTLFASIEHDQLLAASREIEDRAWRVGEGTLRAGFQTAGAFRAQRSLYERMASATDLDVHIHHGDPPGDADAPFAVHDGPAEDVDRFWFVAFDGGDAEQQACALLAEERDPGVFYGFWTYDPDLVEEIIAILEAAD